MRTYSYKMDINTCFKCKVAVSLHDMQKHFVENHSMDFINGDCIDEFVCGFSNCNQSCSTFRALRRHIKNFHISSSSFDNISTAQQNFLFSNSELQLNNDFVYGIPKRFKP